MFYIHHLTHFRLSLLGIVCVGGDGIVNEVSIIRLCIFSFLPMSVIVKGNHNEGPIRPDLVNLGVGNSTINKLQQFSDQPNPCTLTTYSIGNNLLESCLLVSCWNKGHPCV